MSADLPNAFRRLHRILFAIARGMSLLLGGFTLLNVVGELRNPGFDANLWWIDLRFANRHVNCGLMLSIGIAMISFAVRPTLTQCRGWLLSSLLVFMTAIAATNALAFHRLVSAGVIQSSFVIPLSALVVAALLLILWGSRSSLRFAPRHLLDRSCFAISVAAGTILFPLAQMFCFGKTDYRRPADLIVVFGCHVRAEGVPSMALSDRVRKGSSCTTRAAHRGSCFLVDREPAQSTRPPRCELSRCNWGFRSMRLNAIPSG